MEYKKGDFEGINAWYRQSRDKLVPAVWIETRRKLADLFWDCDTLPRQYREWFVKQATEQVEWMIVGVYETVATKRSELWCSFSHGEIDNIPIEYTRKVAKIINRLLYP